MIDRIRLRIESLEKDIGADEMRDGEAKERATQRAALVSGCGCGHVYRLCFLVYDVANTA